MSNLLQLRRRLPARIADINDNTLNASTSPAYPAFKSEHHKI